MVVQRGAVGVAGERGESPRLGLEIVVRGTADVGRAVHLLNHVISREIERERKGREERRMANDWRRIRE